MKTIEKLLALVPNWIGDVAMCTVALRALHQRHPRARLVALGRTSACDLLAGLPWVHDRVEVPVRPTLAEMFRLRKQPEVCRADVAVVFPHSFRAALMARILGARRVVGYSRGGRSILLTTAVPPYRVQGTVTPVYMAKEYLDLVRLLGCEDDGGGLELRVESEVAAAIAPRLAGTRPLIGFAPGAAYGPSKLWPAERYADVADALSERAGARCVLLTAPGEEEVRDAVRRCAKAQFIPFDDDQPSIAKMKAAVAELDLLVCNDSGARHVAVALGVPTVCIMGPTSPAYSCGPYERGTVLRINVDCGPCQKPICETDHRCMTGISPERVIEAALELL
jgi:lipopolysaccharide heptosyltransferase II